MLYSICLNVEALLPQKLQFKASFLHEKYKKYGTMCLLFQLDITAHDVLNKIKCFNLFTTLTSWKCLNS